MNDDRDFNLSVCDKIYVKEKLFVLILILFQTIFAISELYTMVWNNWSVVCGSTLLVSPYETPWK
jgi:hypothetical protein